MEYKWNTKESPIGNYSGCKYKWFACRNALDANPKDIKQNMK